MQSEDDGTVVSPVVTHQCPAPSVRQGGGGRAGSCRDAPMLFSKSCLEDESDLGWSRRLGLTVGLLALLPSLSAIWMVPWMVTQDGPAHLYNASIIAHSGD